MRRIAVSILFAAFALGPGAVSGLASETATRATRQVAPVGNPGFLRVDVEVAARPDTSLAALIEIELVSSDGEWLLARDLGTPLLDAWRGEEEDSSLSTSEAVRSRVRRAGLDPSDTLVALLFRRIRRHSTIEEFRANGWIERAPDGTIRRIENPRMDPADRIMAEMLVAEENDDRLRTARETRRIAPEPPAAVAPPPAGETAPRGGTRAR